MSFNGFSADYEINVDWTHDGFLIAQDVPVNVTVGVDSHHFEDGPEMMVVLDMTFGEHAMPLIDPQRVNGWSNSFRCQIWKDIEAAVVKEVEETFAEDWREEFGKTAPEYRLLRKSR